MPMNIPSAAELIERCRAVGLKVTPQRLAVFRALVGRADHPSPEALFKSVRKEIPAISLATVYKALDALEDAGLVSEVSRLQETKRYDANLSPHHHLVCTECRRIIDVELPESGPPEPIGGFGNFEATQMHVQILGVCGDCRAKKKKKG